MIRVDHRLIIVILLIIIVVLLFIQVFQLKRQASVNTPAREPQTPPVLTHPALKEDFFSRSALFAENYIRGKETFSNNTISLNATKTLDALSILNDQTKESVITVIRFFMVDKDNYARRENEFRQMSSMERTPLWIIILRQGLIKVIPSLSFSEASFDPMSLTENDAR